MINDETQEEKDLWDRCVEIRHNNKEPMIVRQ